MQLLQMDDVFFQAVPQSHTLHSAWFPDSLMLCFQTQDPPFMAASQGNTTCFSLKTHVKGICVHGNFANLGVLTKWYMECKQGRGLPTERSTEVHFYCLQAAASLLATGSG